MKDRTATARRGLRYGQVRAMRRPTAGMALFGMVWLLRVRSEMKRCAKCRRQEVVHTEERASASTFFTIDAPAALPSTGSASPGPLAPTTYCEVHGYSLPKEGKPNFDVCPHSRTIYGPDGWVKTRLGPRQWESSSGRGNVAFETMWEGTLRSWTVIQLAGGKNYWLF